MSTQLRWWHSGQTHSYPWNTICRWRIAIRHRSKEACSIPSQSMLSSAPFGRPVRSQKFARCCCQRRSEEHTSELQSLMRISYAVFCLKKKTTKHQYNNIDYFV